VKRAFKEGEPLHRDPTLHVSNPLENTSNSSEFFLNILAIFGREASSLVEFPNFN
jgi:hypothetical protein